MSRTSECVSSSALLRLHALCIRSFARALLSDSRQWMSHVSHVWISHVTCLCSACTRSTSAFSHDLSLDSTKARVITRACRLIHVFLPRLQIPTPYMPTLPLHNYKPLQPLHPTLHACHAPKHKLNEHAGRGCGCVLPVMGYYVLRHWLAKLLHWNLSVEILLICWEPPWIRKGCWIPTKICNFGRLHNHYWGGYRIAKMYRMPQVASLFSQKSHFYRKRFTQYFRVSVSNPIFG